MPRGTLALLVVLVLGAVPAAAYFESNPKIIEGVPIYNYGLANLARVSHAPHDELSFLEMMNIGENTPDDEDDDNDIEWVVVMKDTATDKEVDALCHDLAAHGCLGGGHPDEHGVAMTGLKATAKGLKNVLAHHTGEVSHVEPNLPIFIPRSEDHIERGSELSNKEIEAKAKDQAVFKGRSPLELMASREGTHSGSADVRRRRANADTAVWGLDRVDDKKGLDGSYHSAYDGHGVHVYVLDTGIKYDHMDFMNGTTSRVVPTIEMWGTEVVECSGPDDSTCAVDRFGHGTHCAGSVGGEQSGVAKGATIHAVKVLSDSGSGSDLGVAMAVDWIMMKGERPAILSMSLGRKGKSATMENVLTKATSAGLTVVVAAGNHNIAACDASPAHVPSVITVGATTVEDARADFSNYGACLDIFAPGKDILSAYYVSAGKYGQMSGTSMACPHVSGFAALLLQANPSLKPQQVAALLKSEAAKGTVTDAGAGSPNLMLYVNPKPPWGKANDKAKSARSRRRTAGRRRRRRRRRSTKKKVRRAEGAAARRRRRRRS